MGNTAFRNIFRKQRPDRRRSFQAIVATVAVLGGLAGCGGSSKPSTTAKGTAVAASTTPSTATTTQATNTSTTAGKSPSTTHAEHVPTVAEVKLTSPVVRPEGTIPARYTCDGQNTPPPLEISGVPAGTVELMLAFIKVQPVNHKLQFVWALTHISPNTHTITTAHPPGTIIGTNSAGRQTYDLCPPPHTSERYVAALFALPRHLPAQPGFDPLVLRHEAVRTAQFEDFLIFGYTRR